MEYEQVNIWDLRPKTGRVKLYETPQLLWEAACGYFQWCVDNPLFETKAFSSQGTVMTEAIPKMRAMTMSQLCFYLGVNGAYFRQLKTAKNADIEGFSTVINDIEVVIYNQKFQGASADLLNANIISRELGLADSMISEVNSKSTSSIVVYDSKTAKDMQAMIDKFENE